MEKKIAIVGAGISGLLACKYTLSKGFVPIVFESQNSIGGVWTKTMESTKLQTPKQAFMFSDFPWPSSVTEDFPNHHQVLEYVQSYASHFDLLKHIKFNTRVVSLTYDGPSEEKIRSWTLWEGDHAPFGLNGKWKVHVEDLTKHVNDAYEVDFVILCLGRYSEIPNIPEFPPTRGPEAFHGKVIHSMEYAAMRDDEAKKFVKGKKVAVVGFGKSGMDIAMECSAVNGPENPCTVLYRTEYWNVPSDFAPWGVPLALLHLNRFSELLVHKPGEGFFLSLLATLLSPVRWGYSKFVESNIKHKLPPEKYGMVPKHGFFQQLRSCLLGTVPKDFYKRVEEGRIIFKKALSFGFCKEGIHVDGDGSTINTDLVIFATGFKGEEKLRNIFTSTFFQDDIVGSPNAALPLYRECIHPRIPQLAVIGFSETFGNLYASEIKCRWLAELLGGTFKLPSIKKMEKDIAEWDNYLKRSSGPYDRRSCIGLHIWYNDQLCKDMEWNPKRKKTFWAELFEPYGPLDYVLP